MNRKPMIIKLIFRNHDGQESNIRHRKLAKFLFSIVMIKYSDKSKGERSYSGLQYKFPFLLVGKPRQQEVRVVGHITSISKKQKTMCVRSYSNTLFPHYSLGS